MSTNNKSTPVIKTLNQKQNSVFDGAYEIERTIGRGRHSVVYKANRLPSKVHKTASTEVALKVLTGSSKNPELNRARMKREAVAMLSCRHPNIVQLYDFVSSKDLYYLSMEFCPGGDFNDRIKELGRQLTVEEALLAISEVLAGIEVIHKAGIIHRDIKPENLLIGEKGETKIADFGIASIPSEDLPIEDTERGVGTFDFLAPELLEQGICSASSDLYSTGVTLFWLLTGHSPHQGLSLTESLEKKLSNTRPRIANIIPDAPRSLDILLDKALHPDPSKRFHTADEFMVQARKILKEVSSPAVVVERRSSLSSNLSQMVDGEEVALKEEPNSAEKVLIAEPALEEPTTGNLKEEGIANPDLLPVVVEGQVVYSSRPTPEDSKDKVFVAYVPEQNFKPLKYLTALAAFLVLGYTFIPFGGESSEDASVGIEYVDSALTGSTSYPDLSNFSRRVGVFYDFFGPGEHLSFSTNRINTALESSQSSIKLGLPGTPATPVGFNRLISERETSFEVAGIELLMTLDENSSQKKIFGSYLDLSTGTVRQWSIL